MIGRRKLTGAAVALGGLALGQRPAIAAGGGFAALSADLARIEAERGGRLGVAVLDTGTGQETGHRAGERFPMCSTFKLLAAAAVLARVDAGTERLDRRIRYTAADLIPWSPVTEKHAGGEGLPLAVLCEATMTLSDNTAANLILGRLGGPAGLTAYVRSLGDTMTRLDRTEPELNEAAPGDPRDTTTPAAMLADLHALALGSALSEDSREWLNGWLLGSKTGDARLRAGLPAGWRAGDKTGTGPRGTSNDVGILWPPGRAPVIVAAYLTEAPEPGAARDATLAAVGQAVAAALGG